jgi:hypothetical protein
MHHTTVTTFEISQNAFRLLKSLRESEGFSYNSEVGINAFYLETELFLGKRFWLMKDGKKHLRKISYVGHGGTFEWNNGWANLSDLQVADDEFTSKVQLILRQ